MVKLVYVSLLIKYEPSENNVLMILGEAGNLIIAGISTVFALDDKYNWFAEDIRIIIGWIGIACVFGNILVQALTGLFQKIRKHKSRLQNCFKKQT